MGGEGWGQNQIKPNQVRERTWKYQETVVAVVVIAVFMEDSMRYMTEKSR